MHMRPEIHRGDFYLVDGATGIQLIPADLVEIELPLGVELTDEEPETLATFHKARAELSIFYDGFARIMSIERHSGWYGRYSAPGYLDATDWVWGESEDEVRSEMRAQLGYDEGDVE